MKPGARRVCAPAGDKLALPDGYQGYALDAVPGLKYTFDGAKLTLDISAPPEAFEASALDSGRDVGPLPNQAPPGFYVNYNLSGLRSSDSGISYGAFVESVAFNSLGSLVNGGILRGDKVQNELIRAETYFQKDLPGSMETLVLGDAIGSGGAWSRPARFGGIRWARNFSLRPGYIVFPIPSFSGSAALPSTIDVLINNQLRQRQTVNPGPFQLSNLPVVTGAGEINLVVRDMLGVERVVTQRYYTSPALLASGLSDFSFEPGLLRENFGNQSFDYSSPFGAGTGRQGLNDKLTGEARLELQQNRQAGGVGLAGLLGTFAVAQAAAYSNANGEQGGQYLLGLSRSTQRGGGSVLWQYFDRGYNQFASLPDEIRPKNRFSAGYGMLLFWGATSGVSYISQSSWDGDQFQLASANLSLSLPWNMYLSVFASRQLDENKGWSGGLNLTMPLGSLTSVSFSSSRDTHGLFTNALQASQSAPQGPGLGWRVRTSDDPDQLLQGGGTLNTNYGQVTADANMGKDSTALRLGASGSIGWLQGMPFATRAIGHGSFALVKVGDLKDVPVYRSNQIVATTNGNGLALVSDLLPYQKNQLTIDPGELPFDIEIKGVKEMPLPYARSGLVV